MHTFLEAVLRRRRDDGPTKARQLDFDSEWAAAIVDAGYAPEHEDPDDGIPGLGVSRARSKALALRVLDRVGDVPGDAVHPEVELVDGGLLGGTADLVVRDPPHDHWIGDYKSGRVTDPGGEAPKDAYRQQLEIYAYLEHAVAGSWPQELILWPLKGDPLVWDVDAGRCRNEVDRAREAVSAYNERLRQPGWPSPEGCAHCPIATRCSEFWETVSPEWASTTRAVEGIIEVLETSALGGGTVVIAVNGGTERGPATIVRQIPTELLSGLEQGSRIRFAGLLEARNSDELRASEATAVWAVPEVTGD